jgi:hypothetical protein
MAPSFFFFVGDSLLGGLRYVLPSIFTGEYLISPKGHFLWFDRRSLGGLRYVLSSIVTGESLTTPKGHMLFY